ncbi:MAG: sortase [Clostridia bacterium]|nr:sortase [Clostridia bacterium]
MNQILITEKIYVTPELRRKKKVYKFQFFLSALLVCLLFSYYIYAEYDRTKSEEVSKEILQKLEIKMDSNTIKSETQETKQDTTIKQYDGIIVVALDDDEEDDKKIVNTVNNAEAAQNAGITPLEYTLPNGEKCYSEARLRIPKLGIDYPVLSDWSEELLKVSLNKYWGPNGPNEVGNYCIVGHNYKSGKMFGNLPGIANGDIIELTDLTRKNNKICSL